ncbi:MAG: winged helix-turn-helix domain-containing protein [Polyangiaceae bacterium]
MTNDAGIADSRGHDGSSAQGAPEEVVIAFGEFTANLRSAELFRQGALVKLQLQPFRVLAALLRRAGTLVTREELRREVWGEHTTVDFEHGLNFCIKQVRAALGDSAEHPTFIETLPRRGYRFIGQVVVAQAASTSGHAFATSSAEPNAAPAAHRAAPVPELESVSESGATLAHRATSGATEESAEITSHRVPPSSRSRAIRFVTAVAVVATLALAIFASRARSGSSPRESAVLFVVPFENLTGDRESDVWCDGLTEEIIASLAGADPARVQVIARTTSMAYRGAKKSLGEIGREVKADLALEGAVRKEGDRLRVTAQLYRVREESPVWADAFEMTGSDVLSVQRRLAAQLASALAIAAQPEAERPAPSIAAQEALAKARYLRNKNDPESLAASLAAFEEALRLDPDNGKVWSETAMAYEAAAFVVPAAVAIEKSCGAAKRARELSGHDALADTALGLCAMHRDWDWSAAETAFATALAKNPGLAVTHHCYAAFLSAAGRHREALLAIARAKKLDPLSPPIVSDAGWHAFLARDYAGAAREFERTLELEPKDAWSREHLMMARSLAGDVEGANREARAWAAMFPLSDEEKSKLAALSPADIVRGTSAAIAARFALRDKSDHPPNPGFIAVKFAGAGDRGAALAWLERAATEHAPWLLPLLRDPRFDALQDDPRFTAIRERAHLPAAEPLH